MKKNDRLKRNINYELTNKKRQRIGLTVGWGDYEKSFGMVCQSWILKCLDIFGDKIKLFIKDSVKNLEIELTVGREIFGKAKIKG